MKNHKAGDKKTYQERRKKGFVVGSPTARNAFQRIHDMILSYGLEEFTEHRDPLIRYHFFKDPMGAGGESIFGLEDSLTHLVSALKSAAHGYGTERRIIIFHGPVGSSKSTMVRLLKKGLELHSPSREGPMCTFAWQDMGDIAALEDCPMREEPLRLLPLETRDAVLREINRAFEGSNSIRVDGVLCPSCRRTFKEYMARCKGDWREAIKHVKVRQLILSEKDRVGIGTFQPKDEKNQNSTELTGDINYRKIVEYGSDSDSRAFNFDGEFNVANRGVTKSVVRQEAYMIRLFQIFARIVASVEQMIKHVKDIVTHPRFVICAITLIVIVLSWKR